MPDPIQRPVIMVLASTYPRWQGDPEPGFVHELCKRLVATLDVIVLTPAAPGAASSETLDGVQVHRYRYAPAAWQTLVHGGGIVGNIKRHPWKIFLLPGFLVGLWLASRQLIRRHRIDAVHAHWVIPQGLLGALLKRPLLVTAHGADVFALRGRVFDWMRQWVVRRAAHVTAVSASLAQALAPVASSKLSVLPMGIDLKKFVRSETSRDSNVLLFVGRLVEKKGMRHLLDAMPAILQAQPEVELWIVGFGPELSALRQQSEHLGLSHRVRFMGAMSQSELPALYQRATLFVAPFVEAANGDREGLGLVVAEAMACGCPVVIGNVGGVGDLIGDQGDRGRLVDARSPLALAEAITTLLRDPARREVMGAKAEEFVRAHFGWDAIAAAYGRILRDVADRVASSEEP
jgi:glycosyltransferase involved in cell wall biosynthesis